MVDPNIPDPRPDIYHTTYWAQMEQHPQAKAEFIAADHIWDNISLESRAVCQAADVLAKDVARRALGLD